VFSDHLDPTLRADGDGLRYLRFRDRLLAMNGRSLRLCFIANAHSVHVRNFMAFFVRLGHEVTLVTPELCLYAIPGIKVVNIRDLTRSQHVRRALRDISVLRHLRSWKSRAISEVRRAILPGRSVLGAAAAMIASNDEEERARWNEAAQQIAPVVNRVVAEGRSDIVQSLRFYPEGLITAGVDHPRKCFFVWGSDLSGYGSWYPEVSSMMRSALRTCAGLLHDNAKDYRVAQSFGLPSDVPHLMVPSNGGVDTSIGPPAVPDPLCTAPEYATVRRMGNMFMNNEPVLRALAFLHADYTLPATYTMYGNQFGPYYDRLRVLAKALGIGQYVHFELPYAQKDVFRAIARYRFQVSPAIDDGTSAALLETMWFGAIPIYSNVEPIREWIVDGKNGYLFEMNDPQGIAHQMLRAWQERERHQDMIVYNRALVRERADYSCCMSKVLDFYDSLL
jgi:glycosyltransferase involved in cell wall biosynthesis